MTPCPGSTDPLLLEDGNPPGEFAYLGLNGPVLHDHLESVRWQVPQSY